jgi:hypothetical protein
VKLKEKLEQGTQWNSRIKFWDKPQGVQFRTAVSGVHAQERAQSAHCLICRLMCTSKCSMCQMPLCTRNNCFTLFHKVECLAKLPDVLALKQRRKDEYSERISTKNKRKRTRVNAGVHTPPHPLPSPSSSPRTENIEPNIVQLQEEQPDTEERGALVSLLQVALAPTTKKTSSNVSTGKTVATLPQPSGGKKKTKTHASTSVPPVVSQSSQQAPLPPPVSQQKFSRSGRLIQSYPRDT